MSGYPEKEMYRHMLHRSAGRAVGGRYIKKDKKRRYDSISSKNHINIYQLKISITRPISRILQSPLEYKGYLKNKIHMIIICNDTPFGNIYFTLLGQPKIGFPLATRLPFPSYRPYKGIQAPLMRLL